MSHEFDMYFGDVNHRELLPMAEIRRCRLETFFVYEIRSILLTDWN